MAGPGNTVYVFTGFVLAMAVDYIGRAYAFPGRGQTYFSDPHLDVADVTQIMAALGIGTFGALINSDMLMALMLGGLTSQGYTKFASPKLGLPRYIIAREAVPL